MNLQTHIRQQQSTVQFLEKMVKARRASVDELEQARRRLADLRGQEEYAPAPAHVPPVALPVPVDVPSGPVLAGDKYAWMQADLSKEADGLNRQMAELSNRLHLVPTTANCPELVKPILALKAQIEAVWDKKRYLERNRALPAEIVPEEEPDYLPELVADDAGKFQLACIKRRLIDQRSKLKRKMGDPKAKPSKRQEWETELAQCERKIQEIEFKLS